MTEKLQDPQTENLREAFRYTSDDNRLDTEKALRAIAFLLEWSAADKPLDAITAQGLAALLRTAANDLAEVIR
jgi:hypothetical protein